MVRPAQSWWVVVWHVAAAVMAPAPTTWLHLGRLCVAGCCLAVPPATCTHPGAQYNPRRREIIVGRLACLGFFMACFWEVYFPTHPGITAQVSYFTGLAPPTAAYGCVASWCVHVTTRCSRAASSANSMSHIGCNDRARVHTGAHAAARRTHMHSLQVSVRTHPHMCTHSLLGAIAAIVLGAMLLPFNPALDLEPVPEEKAG